MRLVVDLFVFILLRVCWALRMSWLFFIKFWSYYRISSDLLLHLSSGTPITHISVFNDIPHFSQALFIFLHFFFFLLFRLHNLYWYMIKIIDFSSASSNLLSTFNEFLISIVVLQNFHLVLYHFYLFIHVLYLMRNSVLMGLTFNSLDIVFFSSLNTCIIIALHCFGPSFLLLAFFFPIYGLHFPISLHVS